MNSEQEAIFDEGLTSALKGMRDIMIEDIRANQEAQIPRYEELETKQSI